MRKDPLRRRGVKASRLKLVAPREQFQDDREPPLRLGDIVRLNSGGPLCLVVDLLDFKSAEVAWRDVDGKTGEAIFPMECIHRVRVVG